MTHLDTSGWMADSALGRLLDALTAIGDTRFIGGMVRDGLLGLPPHDIDLATVALPRDVLKAGRSVGLRMVETGLAHGTVSAILPRGTVEITTLRRDVSTDGRHAEIAFTGDWKEDAARRDFTINALSCDRDGLVFDYFCGVEDLNARRVRFIGDASTRIREDYLRILRFFRFSARYADGLDETALLAIRGNRHGISKLSGERILSETLKLLETPNAAATWKALADTGIAEKIVEAAVSPEHLAHLIKLEIAHAVPDSFRRLMMLMPSGGIDKTARRLKFSGTQRKRAKAIPIDELRRIALHERRYVRALYGSTVEAITDQAFFDAADGSMAIDALGALLVFIPEWKVPIFPLGGENLMELGLKPGPIFGALLNQVERWWIDQEFQPNRQQCFGELKRIWFEHKQRQA